MLCFEDVWAFMNTTINKFEYSPVRKLLKEVYLQPCLLR